jgi:hypothetical protein
VTNKPLKTLLATALIALSLAPGAADAMGGPVRHYPQLAKPVVDTKVRVGPGSMFKQKDLAHKAVPLIVLSCGGGWCLFKRDDGGPGGWIIEQNLIFMGEIHG